MTHARPAPPDYSPLAWRRRASAACHIALGLPR